MRKIRAVMNTALKLQWKTIFLSAIYCITYAHSSMKNETKITEPAFLISGRSLGSSHHTTANLMSESPLTYDGAEERSTTEFVSPQNVSSRVPTEEGTLVDKSYTPTIPSFPSIPGNPLHVKNASKIIPLIIASDNSNGDVSHKTSVPSQFLTSPSPTPLNKMLNITGKNDTNRSFRTVRPSMASFPNVSDNPTKVNNETKFMSTTTRNDTRKVVNLTTSEASQGTTGTLPLFTSDLLTPTQEAFPSTVQSRNDISSTVRTAFENHPFHSNVGSSTVRYDRDGSTEVKRLTTFHFTTTYKSTTVPESSLTSDGHSPQDREVGMRNMTDHGISIALSALPEPTASSDYPREYVRGVQHRAYTIAFPVLIFIGSVANIICIIVLMRPRMRSVPVNKYFLALAWSDLIVCLMNIPIAITTNGCDIRSYAAAVYYGHFGWSTIEVSQTISFYTLLFLSYDRFLAVYFYQKFKQQNYGKILRLRYVITVIADIVIHLFYFFNVRIWCKDERQLEHCESGLFLILDSYRFNYRTSWHTVYFLFHELIIRWIPGLLLVIFNASLVAAIAIGRLSNPVSSHRTKKRTEFRLTITLIGITCSFVVCTFPNTIYSIWFAAHIDEKCYGNHEVFRAVSNNLQLLEHVLHIAFLSMLNPSFRSELMNFLTCTPSPDSPNDAYQSSRDLHMYQINRRSGHSPFPNRSPNHSPYLNKRISGSELDATTGHGNALTPRARY
ncbi:uncharacterized protein [Macrobrachium rosenbergii]|uniref:uncharacterized protein n=1 Tax=Macrobrachium rosenbergii TaxID=79674 RepID=UPI0034D6AFCD